MSIKEIKGHTNVNYNLILLENEKLTRHPLAFLLVCETVTIGVCFLSQSA